MRQYETGFILSPSLAEEETDQFVGQMAEIVAQKKGRMIRQDIWGKRKLAYPIKKFQDGFYVFFVYEGGGDISLELERRFKQSDSVLRFMTVKLDPRGEVGRKKKPGDRKAAAASEGGGEPAPSEKASAEGTEEHNA